MIWARMLAYITGTVDQELLLRNEYLTAENRILRAKVQGRLLLSDSEKATLAEIAKRLGRKAQADIAAVAKPDTLLRWYGELISKKFDGSRFRRSVGRPPVNEEIERLIVRIAKENPSWGYDRIVGAMMNLGHKVSDQTVGNILRRHDTLPAPKRKHNTSWKDFIRAHMAVIVGTDFFTVEVLTLKGLKTYYVLFSCISRAGESTWRASRVIQIRSGWSRWLATSQWKVPGFWPAAVICCMIATASSAHHFDT